MLSLVSVSVFAAETLAFTVKVTKDGNEVSQVKAGETVNVSYYIPAGTYTYLGIDLLWNENVTPSNLKSPAVAGAMSGIQTAKANVSANNAVIADGVAFISIDITVKDTAPAGSIDLIKVDTENSAASDAEWNDYVVGAGVATATIPETAVINAVDAAPAVAGKPVGTTADDIKVALGSTIKVTDADKASAKDAMIPVAWDLTNWNPLSLEEQTINGTVTTGNEFWSLKDGFVQPVAKITLVPLTEGTVTADIVDYTVKALEEGENITVDNTVVTGYKLTVKSGDVEDTYTASTVEATTVKNEVAATATANIVVSGASDKGYFNLAETKVPVTVTVVPAEVAYEVGNFAIAQKKIRKSGDIAITINNVKAEGATEAVYEITLVRGEDAPYVATKTIDLTAKAVGAYSEIVKIAAEDAFADIAVDDVIAVSVKADGATMFCDEDKNTSVDVTVVKGSNRPAGGGIPSNGGTVKPGTTTPVDPTPVDPTPVDPTPVDPTPVTPVEGEFTDVAGHWAEEAINNLKDKGVVGGKGEGVFDPDGQVTRAEFAKMIAVMFDLKAVATESAFTDCTAADWFTPYVIAAAEAGYIKGVSDTEFAPNALITRQDICTILGRVLNTTADGAEFVDSADIADYAAEYVDTLVGLGVINGYEDGTFKPLANATRAEVAKILDAVSKLEVAEEEATEEVVEEEATEEVVEEATEEEVVEEETTEEEVVEEEATEEEK